tara:strand:+ start:345 stop:797 length:453 start_codon:yes stop_codon:yes gene_type:complete
MSSYNFSTNAQLVLNAYATTGTMKCKTYNTEAVFVPSDPKNPFNPTPLDGKSYTESDTKSIELVAFPDGNFTLNDCNDFHSNGQIDFTKIQALDNKNKQKIISFHRALTLLYGKEGLAVKDKGKKFHFGPFYHIQSLADATKNINQANSP